MTASNRAPSVQPPPERQRPRGRPWPKGVSGNPSGLPKAIVEVRALAREHTADAIAALVSALDDASGAVRVRAAEALLDRAWGRPTQAIDVGGGEDSLPPLKPEELTDEQLLAIIATCAPT